MRSIVRWYDGNWASYAEMRPATLFKPHSWRNIWQREWINLLSDEY
jgi:hypothetical protein